uniref:B-cell lymphoma 9 beta-catenin binding domain-containing protein n=1 Tax=Trichogramma kaykai TaxID=54128 RepID=A0ABD2X2V5_9HYME
MKTEKKSSEPSCVSPAIAKEEPNAKRTKIKDETAIANPEEVLSENLSTDCLPDALLEPPSITESSASKTSISDDNQNGTPSEQNILNSIKAEAEAYIKSEPVPGAIAVHATHINPQMMNVNKPISGVSNTSEAQYMQQQSQIFVFSTQMANKGAEMVMQGQFNTIIAYHMAQPNTKKYLEKLPNKMINFRQNQNQWINNFNSSKRKGINSNLSFANEAPPDILGLESSDPAFWNEQSNIQNINGNNPIGNPESAVDNTNINVPCPVPNSPSSAANAQPIGGPTIDPNTNLIGNTSPGSGRLVQPSLAGVKVPDENLTPEQRQHRLEQLNALNKLGEMLMGGNGGMQMESTQGNNAQNLTGPNPMNNLPPVSGQNQYPPQDWQKSQPLQSHKTNLRSPGMPIRNIGGGGIVGGPNSVSGNITNSGPIVGPPGGPRSQGPPPPYHQTTRSASVPIAIQSPNPVSPNNPTSNLSLPSPRASSALNSPADCNRQFQLGSGGSATTQAPGSQRSSTGASGTHLQGQSPTSQDSPAGVAPTRINHSNPGTPLSHNHLATAPSPSGTPQKDSSSLDFPTNQSSSIDGMFRSLPSMAPQKPAGNPNGPKELMPVPSPQQISYLTTFEGQELTIQKQPNTTVKDGSSMPTNHSGNINSEMNNRMLSGGNIDGTGVGSGNGGNNNNPYASQSEGASPGSNRGFGHSPHTPHTPHTPGSVAPHTPNIDTTKTGNKNTSAQSSPASHNAALADMGMGPPRTVPASPNTKIDTSPTSKELQQQQLQQNVSNIGPTTQSNIPNNMMPSMAGPGNNVSYACPPRAPLNVNQTNDNIPLNPNNIGNRMGGFGSMSSNNFDPISSLAQMSQQLTNTTNNSALNNENSVMHGANHHGMMSFNQPPHNMHMMPQQMQQNELNGSCHMGPGPSGPGPGPGPSGELSDVTNINMGLGGPATSYSPTSHTGSPGMQNKMSQMGSMGMGPHGMMGGPPGSNMHGNVNMNVNVPGAGYAGGPGPGSGMMGGPGQHNMHHGPYNGANIQVKPSAPNTIQYLPARPNIGHPPRGPPSLDFLPRFPNPMNNMENKMNSPNVNLPYFPNGSMPQGPPGSMGGGSGPGGQQLGPVGPGGMGGPAPGMHPGMRPQIRQQPNLMRMQHMGGGGVFPGNPMDQDKLFNPDMMGPGPQSGNSASGMYGGPKLQHQNPMGQMGPVPPDATQPLPPSMGAGAGPVANFKNSPFIGGGPNMSDPNYAQQFHNFQQQLYATGTRGASNGPQGGPGPGSGHPGSMHNQQQQFFMPK